MFLFNFISAAAAYDVSYYIAVTYSDWGLYRKDEPFFFLVLAVIPMCLTLFYILTRLNVMFPMLIMDRKISLKNIFIISNDSYLKWAAVAAAIYFPLLFIEQYYREEPLYNICNAVLTLLVCCFFSCYYNSKKDLLL